MEVFGVGEDGLGALGEGLVAVPAQEGVEPDEAAAGAGKAFDFGCELAGVVAFEAVGEQQGGGALAEDAARPKFVEPVQAMADAGAAGPVFDDAGNAGEREIDVAVGELAADVGQAGAEHEAVNPAAGRDGVHEMQEHARIGAH